MLTWPNVLLFYFLQNMELKEVFRINNSFLILSIFITELCKFKNIVFFLYISGEGGEWCKLAYWELQKRVGRLFSVDLPFLNVFTSLPHGDGLCLATLTQDILPPSDSVRRTRSKIGLGKFSSTTDWTQIIINRL